MGKGAFLRELMGAIAERTGDAAPASPKVRAFHGSPHDFDRFSLDKIGTGEGAQAYGHGLYFAENEGVARGYRDTLVKQKKYDPTYWVDKTLPQSLSAAEGDELRRLGQKMMVEGNLRGDEMARWKGLYAIRRNYEDAIEAQAPIGHMYEVEIDADPNAFLDWDKPLSEQPEAVRSALTSFGVIKNADKMKSRAEMLRQAGQNDAANEIEASLPYYEKMLSQTGDELHQRMFHEARHELGGQGGGKAYQAQVAEKLREAGIPGIKYLDAGSRSAGDGSRNYVVFDDKLISIVRKFGIAGASTLLGYNLLDSVDPAQAEELKRIEAEGDEPEQGFDKGGIVKKLMRLYHGTKGSTPERATTLRTPEGRSFEAAQGFEGLSPNISPEELGLHLGSQKQANTFGGYKPEFDDPDLGYDPGYLADNAPVHGRVIPLDVDVQNPLRLQDKTGNWEATEIYDQLARQGKIENNSDLWSELNNMNSSDATRRIRELIESLGHDGVVYKNRYETGLPPNEAYKRAKAAGVRVDELTDEEFSKLFPEAEDSYIVWNRDKYRSPFGEGTGAGFAEGGEVDDVDAYFKRIYG